jgi:hypothetical protein
MAKQNRPTVFPFRIEDRGLSFFLEFLVLIAVFVPMVRLSRSGRIGLDLISRSCSSQGRSQPFAIEFFCI